MVKYRLPLQLSCYLRIYKIKFPRHKWELVRFNRILTFGCLKISLTNLFSVSIRCSSRLARPAQHWGQPGPLTGADDSRRLHTFSVHQPLWSTGTCSGGAFLDRYIRHEMWFLRGLDRLRFGGFTVLIWDLSTVYTMWSYWNAVLDRRKKYAYSEIQLSDALKASLLDTDTTAGSTIKKKCLC